MITYTLKRNRLSKRVRILIRQSGVTVTAPVRVSKKTIDQFVASRSRWIKEKETYFATLPSLKNSKQEYLKYKDRARELVETRLKYFNQFYGFKYNKIYIRNQTTRWGSCSHTGNLSFNYKLALLSQEQADYVIVHELCHLGQMNHSSKFWALVVRTIPDYLRIKGELRKKSINLN